ncbi:glyceraldehyde 3-phosphate dehydrogenase NAD-binding domain-containing protein [Magnetococcus sp. PR-3]|uniref:glyceraldehyde 3-phosphate dehydrogenase NAD-binding domain-containing protein n=1 Tax=Magnetococcus sp. PR-3 TaxID=3120355 RepID=UPI002FCE17AB
MQAPLRVAIHGFGRIGRVLFRQLALLPQIQVVAINDTAFSTREMAYLANFDSVYGRCRVPLTVINDHQLALEDQPILTFSQADFAWIPANTQILIDASGDKQQLLGACRALAIQVDQVLITCPLHQSDVALNLYGVQQASTEDPMVSFSSCDAAAVAPLMAWFEETYGVEEVAITTLHPVLNNQNVLDGKSPDDQLQLGRSALNAVIPKTSSLQPILQQLFPHCAVRVLNFRVPTNAVTCAQFHFTLKSESTLQTLREELLGWIEEQGAALVVGVDHPATSLDFVGESASLIMDWSWLEVSGKEVRGLIWYDNEWGYAAQITRYLLARSLG